MTIIHPTPRDFTAGTSARSMVLFMLCHSTREEGTNSEDAEIRPDYSYQGMPSGIP